jgi:hypothetical protein
VPRTRESTRPVLRDGEIKALRNRITLQGRILTWSVDHINFARPSDKPRGIITEFTRKARLRMLCWFNTVYWEDCMPASFITLTFPDERKPESSQFANQLRWCFWRALERKVNKQLAGVWRVEWKARQTGSKLGEIFPHFHFIVFDVPFVHRDWISQTWAAMLKVSTAVTHIRKINNLRAAGGYVSKYLGKADGCLVIGPYLSHEGFGRQWGIFRKKLIPLYAKLESDVDTDARLLEIKRRLRPDITSVAELEALSLKAFGPLAYAIWTEIFGLPGVDQDGPDE